MQTVRAGDVYFLRSPFHADNHDTDKEKRLSYLLGTVSARPAVVVRPPYWWDNFSMVTVIPALSHGAPAITLKLNDRYDRETKSDYPFVPHHAISIPVSRLGHYIGSLDDQEIEELMYAFHWVMDPRLHNDEKYPAPRCYKNVVRNKIPKGSWIAPRDPRSDAVLRIGDDNGTMSIHSETNPEINGTLVSEEPMAIHPRTERAMTREPVFIPVETHLPDVKDDTKEDEEMNVVPVPVEKKFPPSIFSLDVLNQVAGRFDIDSAHYLTAKKRDPYVVDPDKDFLRHGLSDKDITNVFEYYKTMEPMDAYLLGPRLPTFILAEITGFDHVTATVLKLICNLLRDMPDEEYDRRYDEMTQRVAQKDDAKPIIQAEEQVDYKPIVQRLRSYLTQARITRIPEDLQEDFLSVPKGIIKRAWTGKQFELYYKKAVNLYTAQR